MRRLLLTATLTLALPSLAEAAPCGPASLADYISLGAGGCTAGGALFSDFDAGSLLFGATPIAATAVTVTPLGGGVGLAFGLDDPDAGPGELLDILIRYSVSGLLFGFNSLSMSGSSATGDGVVTAVEDKCIGGSFLAFDPTSLCSGSTLTLIVTDLDGTLGDLLSETSGPIGPTSFFDVFTEITLDGASSGTAELSGTVVNEFTVVPEPSTLLLIGSALAGMAARRRREPR